MLLIVGLGNPGEKYARHRHNVGFMAVDAIAEAHGFSPARGKFSGDIRDGQLDARGVREKAIILKPSTYMNESGRAVGEAMRFHKIALSDVIVFHDELDLPPGKIRVKTGGGNAGHNGLKSITAHIGPDFRRVRIGIGHPGHKDQVSNYVLGDFAKADRDWLDPLLADMARAAPYLLLGDKEFLNEAARLAAPANKAAPAQGNPVSGASKAASKGSSGPAAPQASEGGGNPFADILKKLKSRPD